VSDNRISAIEAELRILATWRTRIVDNAFRQVQEANAKFDDRAMTLHKELQALRAAQPELPPPTKRVSKPPRVPDLGSDEDNAHFRELEAKFRGV